MGTARPDILDRNGEMLATDVRTPSLFGEPHRIIDVDEASELLTAAMPDIDAAELRERLASKRRFVWLKREITPKQREQIYRVGIPGIGFLPENKRVYPNGAEVSHVIGHVNIDNQGIAGIEKWLDGRGLADLHMAGLATEQRKARSSLRSIFASSMRCVTSSSPPGRNSKPWPQRASLPMCAPARSSRWSQFPIMIPTIRAKRLMPPASTG